MAAGNYSNRISNLSVRQLKLVLAGHRDVKAYHPTSRHQSAIVEAHIRSQEK